MSVTAPHVPSLPNGDSAAPAPASEPSGPAAGSLLSTLHAKRQELAHEGVTEERKPIPGWDGALSIVYRYPDGGADAIIRATERAAKRGKPVDTFNANCDMLIACWHTIEGRQPGGDWEPLEPGTDRVSIARAGRLLQIDVPDTVKSPARFILRELFSPKAVETGVYEGDVALMTQAGQIIGWLSGLDAETDKALEGE